MRLTLKDNATTSIDTTNIKSVYGIKGDVIEMQIKKNDQGKPQMLRLFYKSTEDCASDLSVMVKDVAEQIRKRS